MSIMSLCDWSCFNSRAHAGRDKLKELAELALDVSIHAPTRGATFAVFARSRLKRFQFTRPRGARLQISAIGLMNAGFNSRAHAGRDKIESKVAIR
mgnify:CR=1 FL=1